MLDDYVEDAKDDEMNDDFDIGNKLAGDYDGHDGERGEYCGWHNHWSRLFYIAES